ncbi:phosphoribosylglycinamide formyltransferase [Spirochaeta lutea]|uniref:Phosphoribosylglycinamide formyltransferase n=1 Tax=Spirochaeta lutea TaxID=1480694 RepID=A0A098R0U9_9SPIO|nr:phosphoribosylglycinamide formyltransferase [Spirochaeta lutea]KGE73624.1 hypothetical protein DC28_03000 [Spirochaeta lutea]
MAKLAVFASGRGSNLNAIYDYLDSYRHELALIVTDIPNSGAAQLAHEWDVPLHVVDYSKLSKSQAEAQLQTALSSQGIQFIALAGFMRILSPGFTKSWEGKLINIHPSLLPKYPGAHGIRDSYASTDSELGITIHFVDAGIDTGAIIFQERFTRRGTESREDIESRIHQIEHASYPVIIKSFLDRIDPEEEQS